MILAPVNLYSLLRYLGLAICRKAEPLAILCPHWGEAMQDIEYELLRIRLPRTPVNKGKRAARWKVTQPTTKVCRWDSTGEGVYDPRVRAFVSRRQLADELF
jgi:hypothetical protein